MDQELDRVYEKLKDRSITFNQEVIDSLGLINEKFAFSCGNEVFPSIIYSSSMMETKIIAKLDPYFFKFLAMNRNTIVLRFLFKHPNHKTPITYLIYAKVRNHKLYECDTPNLHFISVEFIKTPPEDFIKIMSRYLIDKIKGHNRLGDRVILDVDDEERLGVKLMKNYLFIDGKRTECVLTEISIFSAKVLVNGEPESFPRGVSSLLVMRVKSMDTIGEMMGTIERVEVINKRQKLMAVIINFNQDMIPPQYKMWIAECIEVIKVRPKSSRLN